MRSSPPSSATSSRRRAAPSRDGKRAPREAARRPRSVASFLIITGLSGAGKSYAMRVFEDLDFFVVDNLPPQLLPKFADLCLHSDGKVQRVAVVMDIRGGEFFDELFEALTQIEQMGLEYQILFLDAADEALVRRFKETRRPHPLGRRGILQGIRAERRRLEAVKERADKILDTSAMTVRELRNEILRTYGRDEQAGTFGITITSFGYKHGLPMDADLVFDCRFLPNPHYNPRLRPLPGGSKEVRDYVLSRPETQTFLRQLYRMMDYLVPQFVHEGKSHLTVAIGCTGGKHRSVVLADELATHLSERGLQASARHRDVRKDS